MPVYRLNDRLIFPPPEFAEPEGLLAVGGDLSPSRLLLAYSMGIFPWFSEEEPILWWSPDPRCVLAPAELKISRSLAKTLRQDRFRVGFNEAFPAVVAACADSRRGQGAGTWITGNMQQAYDRLHRLGFAHSVECWQGDELVGGLYGVCLGRCFFGESMFHRATDASKVALVALARRMEEKGWPLIDCQLPNPHLVSLGAKEIPRREFLRHLRSSGVAPNPVPSPPVFP
ncbi:MAG: leucyl/phenylalanyl-tRNA--protein transferase [Desulfuromonadaceae bacterium GWC2_58_13]|nr:MAG: leucyl/phenylalanyl-tRNA--protein transferase [Desulfuromonadaceae bacterium GWC2_58_13]